MSLISRITAPAASHDVAGLVRALLSAGVPAEPRPSAPAKASPGPRLPSIPTGLGTTAARISSGTGTAGTRTATSGAPRVTAPTLPLPPPSPTRQTVPVLPTGPTGLGTAAVRPEPAAPPRRESAPADPAPRLHCPPAARDDRALGDTVTERLVQWAEEIGIYPGQLDKIRKADFGRLIMLAHPESDDPDRLLAAAKCALSEWAVDDHYVDGEVEEARHDLLGQRLAIAHSVIDQANLPLAYAGQLEEVVTADPVCRALRDSLRNLASYATTSQVRRLRHELGIMFVAYGQEGVWHTKRQTPPVWEFLMHRHENSFIPCMVLIDAVAGYELPYGEFSDPRVRRAFTLAGTASVIVNDLYSMGKEDPTDFSLPRLIVAEDDCSLQEAVDRTVDIHNELMHTFEAEAAALALTGSPELRRFLAGTWAWLGGNREWHASSGRYHGDANAA
ncbi:family 2 encapsulin nanocompartment cargo protein terpene cyclase [Streptomyces sp. DG2A-72]|uniref:family 2 encapsulin nanocompartment cargo protein terpene cyclase n=1 Tax=Streptomyces sp. DG2A-72 TaxID=3051386 RepID=UPI00265C1E9F|nr:family 2 encapsulin nanocompartment cargo protein terpene cyclase [Streptomyces sp. DG2A-72]MDO0938965.1 family 2 encapsulin nanocompartment cargo protein terpene cyclase [Streptomyces sp. DG2A-72]